MWHPEHLPDDDGAEWSGQYLRCLKATVPGDRQVVWEGQHGRGLVAVVDFGDYARLASKGVYERWARITLLRPVITREAIRADPVLCHRFFGAGAKGLQGNAIGLSTEEAEAIGRQEPRLPPLAVPDDMPRGDEAVYDWAEEAGGWAPESVLEMAAAGTRHVWRKMGFSERPRQQVFVLGAGRPDLLSPGTVGEVKRRIRVNDGPAQLERYLDALTDQQPEHAPWAGVLVQHDGDLDPGVAERLGEMTYAVEVFSLYEDRHRWHADSLLTQGAATP